MQKIQVISKEAAVKQKEIERKSQIVLQFDRELMDFRRRMRKVFADMETTMQKYREELKKQ